PGQGPGRLQAEAVADEAAGPPFRLVFQAADGLPPGLDVVAAGQQGQADPLGIALHLGGAPPVLFFRMDVGVVEVTRHVELFAQHLDHVGGTGGAAEVEEEARMMILNGCAMIINGWGMMLNG
ncbi:MAG TPA: hypothetical protein VJA25_12430, partial [Dehalococcoidia bacterium]|nr:hypothetical protein [Dehalococcoidia bacterium]